MEGNSSSTQPHYVLYDPTRRTWLAAAWLLGASWGQLAVLHGVSRGALAESAKRALTPGMIALRVSTRKRDGSRMSMEKLISLRELYIAHREDMTRLPADVVATQLDELLTVL